jgi:acyl-CoA synthetase (NDP forming)
MNIEIYIASVRHALADPGVDEVTVMGMWLTPESNRKYVDAMIQARTEFGKPLLMANIPGFDPGLGQGFCQAGLPFFETPERAMSTNARIRNYQMWRAQRGNGKAATAS